MKDKLFETVLIEDGEIRYRSFHEDRMNRSRKELFNASEKIMIPAIDDVPGNGLFRCKIIYRETIEDILFEPYSNNRIFKSFKLIHDAVDYRYKYLNRDNINSLLAQKDDCDDIIIIRKGCITDTSIANIAIFIEETWFTPVDPLLRGTTRERYLMNGSIKERTCTLDDLHNSEKIALMNALVDFYVIEKPIFI